MGRGWVDQSFSASTETVTIKTDKAKSAVLLLNFLLGMGLFGTRVCLENLGYVSSKARAGGSIEVMGHHFNRNL